MFQIFIHKQQLYTLSNFMIVCLKVEFKSSTKTFYCPALKIISFIQPVSVQVLFWVFRFSFMAVITLLKNFMKIQTYKILCQIVKYLTNALFWSIVYQAFPLYRTCRQQQPQAAQPAVMIKCTSTTSCTSSQHTSKIGDRPA